MINIKFRIEIKPIKNILIKLITGCLWRLSLYNDNARFEIGLITNQEFAEKLKGLLEEME